MTLNYKLKTSIARALRVLALLAMTVGLAHSQPAFAQQNDDQNNDDHSDISRRENHGKHISKELKNLANDSNSGDKMIEVIIQFRHHPQETDNADVQDEGGQHRSQLHLINGNLYRIPAKALKRLAKNPNILYISPNRKSEIFADYANTTVGADWVQSYYGLDGTGVGVAVIDSGVAPSLADLNDYYQVQSRVVYSESFVSGVDANDAYGHGTHVAGIVGGNGSASNGMVKGIAPGVNIINLRVLDARGGGSESAVINAIQRAIQLKDTYNIRVINLSLGHRVYESYKLDPLCQAAEQAWKAGIVVVTAAGNLGRDNSMGTQGYGTIASPGNDPYVLTVGATNTRGTPKRSDDIIASFSSKGPTLVDRVVKPDLVAPGNQIASLLAKGSTLDLTYPKLEVSPSVYGGASWDTPAYFTLSGTSMATPMVSGAAALLLQQDPSLTPDQVKARLMKTASKFFRGYTWASDSRGNQYNTQYDVFAMGAGYLNVSTAINNSDRAKGVALSPVVTRDLLGNVSLTTDPTSVWGGSVLWGSSMVWGSSVVWGGDAFAGDSLLNSNSVLWGSSVVWGASGTSGYSVIWGSSVVWGGDSLDALSAGDSDQ